MSITHVGSGAFDLATGSGNTVTAAWPSGYSATADDVAVVLAVGNHDNASSLAPSDPSGYTLVDTVFRNVAAFDLQVTVWIKKLDGTESAPSTTVPAAYAGTSGGLGLAVAVFRGVDTTTPQDVTAVTSSATATSTWVPTGLTTVTNDAWVLSIVGSDDDNALGLLSGSEQGFTAHMSGSGYDTTVGGDVALGLATKEITTAGAVTCPTWEQTAVASDAWAGITLALRPAVSGTTGSATVTLGSLVGTATGIVGKVASVLAALGALSIATTGTVAHTGSSSGSFGGLTASATEQVAHTGSVTAPLGALVVATTGTVAHTGSTSVPLGALVVATTGTVAHTGSTSVPLGALVVATTGTVTHQGSISAPLSGLSIAATVTTVTITGSMASVKADDQCRIGANMRGVASGRMPTRGIVTPRSRTSKYYNLALNIVYGPPPPPPES